jgi:hypothetical protein
MLVEKGTPYRRASNTEELLVGSPDIDTGFDNGTVHRQPAIAKSSKRSWLVRDELYRRATGELTTAIADELMDGEFSQDGGGVIPQEILREKIVRVPVHWPYDISLTYNGVQVANPIAQRFCLSALYELAKAISDQGRRGSYDPDKSGKLTLSGDPLTIVLEDDFHLSDGGDAYGLHRNSRRSLKERLHMWRHRVPYSLSRGDLAVMGSDRAIWYFTDQYTIDQTRGVEHGEAEGTFDRYTMPAPVAPGASFYWEKGTPSLAVKVKYGQANTEKVKPAGSDQQN